MSDDKLREVLKEHARAIVASLAGASPTTLHMLAAGVRLAAPPLNRLEVPIFGLANGGDQLPLIQLRFELRRMVRFENLDELLARLDGLEQPPWPQVREALVAGRGV